MGLISLDYVISYSSQDNTYRAENLIQNPGSGKSFLSAPDDKTGRLIAEFQLSKTSRIDFIDIGNHGSSTVEIQVGRSSYHSKTHYVSFLPAVTLLSLADLKESVDRTAVYMFNKSNFSETAATDKWDRIKVICCQPYRKNTQFGLSFLSLRTNEQKTELSINDQSTLSDKNDRSPFKHSKEYGPNLTFTRGKQLLNASRSKITQAEEKPHSPTFEEDVNVFLIACLEEDENKTMEDYMKEFEEQCRYSLNTAEKVIFRNSYMTIRGNAFISDYNSETYSSRGQDSRKESSRFHHKNDSEETEISFDLQLSTPKRQKSSEDSDEADNMKRALKRLKRPAGPSKAVEIFNVSPEDFIQSDGVQPSTSSGVTYVDCPICREFFPSQEIERHASTCGDLTADVEYLYSNKPNALQTVDKEDTFITCLFCEEFFPQGKMSSHMDLCVEKCN